SMSKMGELQAGVDPPRKPELQSPKHMVPITIRRTMVAIVKEQYVATPRVLDAAADLLPRLRCPVSSGYRPHHHLGESHCSNGPMKLGTTKTKRRADAGTMPACRFEYRLFTAVQLIHNVLSREKQRVWMRVGVISNHVLSRRNFRR